MNPELPRDRVTRDSVGRFIDDPTGRAVSLGIRLIEAQQRSRQDVWDEAAEELTAHPEAGAAVVRVLAAAGAASARHIEEREDLEPGTWTEALTATLEAEVLDHAFERGP